MFEVWDHQSCFMASNCFFSAVKQKILSCYENFWRFVFAFSCECLLVIVPGANSEEVAGTCMLGVCYCDSRVSKRFLLVFLQCLGASFLEDKNNFSKSAQSVTFAPLTCFALSLSLSLSVLSQPVSVRLSGPPSIS